MGSEGPPGAVDGTASAVARLAAVLTAASGSGRSSDTSPTPRELAELLWLAQQLEATREGAAGARTGGPDGHRPADAPRAPDTPAAPRPTPPPPGTAEPRVPLHLPEAHRRPAGASPGGGGAPLLAPAPPMLHHPLALQRALRPLKRKAPATRDRLLDEHATADRIARLGADLDAWLPVLRPAPERWLRLNLVYDAGPTMPVWRPLVRELHTLLAQSGVFRTVTLHRATPDGRTHRVPALADGRTVTLVVSDCMGPQWRPGPAGERWYRTLRHWASRMPLAVVQPLPEHLWHGTALPAGPGLLTAAAPAAPTTALTFTAYDPDDPEVRTALRGAIPLPVLEPAPAWLAHWSTLIAAAHGGPAPGAVAWLPPSPEPPAEEAPDIASLPASELVLRFRATASAEAFRLAGHLALTEPTLPVMRLVQRALEADPRPQHLAEIILSGMLRAVPGRPGTYVFRDRALRELLLRSLPRTARSRTREFLARVGGLIDDRAGLAAGEVPAVAPGRGDADGGGTAFAAVREETVRRLGGGEEADGRLVGERYRLLGRRGPNGRVWAAVDTRTDRPVVVHLYAPQGAARKRFLREALALAGLRHPNVVRVLDFGVDGETPYLVAEFLDGVTLAELRLGSGPGVSFRVFFQLVRDVLPALEALHERGLVRGQEGADGLLLQRDGRVVLSRFALGAEADGLDASSDFLLFHALLSELISRSPPERRFQRMGTELAQGPDPARAVRGLRLAPVFSWARSEAESDRMTVTMLGPPHIRTPGRFRRGLSPEGQALLCILLLRQGRRVTHDELAEGLWEDPPSGTGAARRLLPLADEVRQYLGPGTLAALSDGYALHAPGDYIDVQHFEDLVAERTDDLDADAERSLIDDALSLWYGVPLEGVPGPAAEATRKWLDELRAGLSARRARLDPSPVDLGREQPSHLIAFEAVGLSDFAEARDALGEVVARLLSAPGLAQDRYEARPAPHGRLVGARPGTDVRPLLSAVLRELPAELAALTLPTRFRVTFWHTTSPDGTHGPLVPPALQDMLEAAEAYLLVVLSPALHEELADSPDIDIAPFQPVYPDPDDPAPAAWCRAVPLPTHETGPGPASRDLVRGPFTTDDTLRLASPDPARTAIVYTQRGAPLTLLGPISAPSVLLPRRTTYYEVDLTMRHAERTVTLPSSAGGTFTATAELSWQVDDPVSLVRSRPTDVEGQLFEHLTREAARVTRLHPLRRAGAAQRALHEGLRNWPVPGLSVTCSVLLAAEEPPRELSLPPVSPGSDLGPQAATRALRQLVLAATVRIHRATPDDALDDPGTFLGSGFCVAPGWILTCAHVAHQEHGDEVAVVYEPGPGREPSAVPGRVAMTLPVEQPTPVTGLWPAPDLALVRLLQPVDHDIVYVSERASPYYAEGRVLYAGWAVLNGRLHLMDGTLSVQGTIGGWSSGVQLRLGGGDLPLGVSGGPVIDPVRGEVVGVLKSRGREGLVSGGTATGIEQLRSLPTPAVPVRSEHDDLYQAVFHAHDRYHSDRQRPPATLSMTWADVQGELGSRPGRALAPYERVRLLGLLAELPPPVDSRALLDILDSLLGFRTPPASSAPRAWRDGLGLLYESGRGDDGMLELVLDYAMGALAATRPFVTSGTAAAEDALWNWVWQTAQGRSLRYRRGLAQRHTEWLRLRRPPDAP